MGIASRDSRSGVSKWGVYLIHSSIALDSPEKREMLLTECDKYGVELILGDGAYANPAVDTAEYFDHPASPERISPMNRGATPTIAWPRSVTSTRYRLGHSTSSVGW